MTDYHLIKYADIAVTNIIYLSLDSKIYSKSLYIENLLYVLRFSLIEILVEDLPKEEDIFFWNWDALIRYISEKYDIGRHLSKLVDMFRSQNIRIPHTHIRELFLESLKLCDYQLTGIEMMNLSEWLDMQEV